jgi:hypothetical protein
MSFTANTLLKVKDVNGVQQERRELQGVYMIN